ncbi:glycoside hydrolase family 20 protein [Jaapia argillacea MUCL 33604]|uniref:Beta-hexosaminidase n=1 Tax=Jaapia argillacea MUCL 33604 TaxID=933084 RepID=A0A067Q7C5_9AGAM|nr:glycoside hydrolase family 20 protein [Jaapia argillacea MUCL 33604]
MFGLGVVSTLLAALVVQPVTALWPLPTSMSSGTEALRLAPWFSIDTSSIPNPPSDLIAAIERTKTYLFTDQLELLDIDRGASYASSIYSSPYISSLSLCLTGSEPVLSISTEAIKPLESRDDSYTLSVPTGGAPAEIKANTTLGLLRGLTTFGQMWYDYQGQTYTLMTPLTVEDSPAYPYRGFMLDTARNFFPVTEIYRMLDAMSWVKINQFHWHVVDSQSFPLVVPGFENISYYGAYTPTSVYEPTDVANVVAYAAARGIDVLVEIDTPGHTSIIWKSYPEHVACPEYTPWATYANEPPAGQLRFASPATTNFTASLLGAVASMFPSTLFSTGGDELNTNCYTNDSITQYYLNSTGETLEQALSNFTVKTHSVLEAMGKTPVVWEEMVLVHNVTLSNETIVMVWISSEDVAAVAEKGFKIVHAASNYFYLDCGGGGWVGDNPAGNSWCDPFKTWQNSYTFDPNANLTVEQQKLIMGGEHLLWTEQSSPSNLDPIVWPRAASSAELFWTGPYLTNATAGGTAETNVTTALPRLHDVAYRMVQRGIMAIPLQPMWCALRPYACDLTA